MTEDLPLVGDAMIDSNDVVAYIERCWRRGEGLTVGGVRFWNDAGAEVRYGVRVDEGCGNGVIGEGLSRSEAKRRELSEECGVLNSAWDEDLGVGGKGGSYVMQRLAGDGKVGSRQC